MIARRSSGFLVLACALLGCSLEGFADGAGGSGGGSSQGGSGSGGDGGEGGSACGCDCAAWSAVQIDAAGPATLPAIVATGDGWAVAWQDGRHGNSEVYFARLDSAGTLIGAPLRITDDAAESLAPALVWNGMVHAITWEDTRAGKSDVYISLVDAAGIEVLPDKVVWGGTGAPAAPVIGWSEAGYVLTWQDFRDAGFKLHTGNVAADGAVIHADERITDPASGDCRGAAMAAGNGEYGVAWQDSRDGDEEVYFRRIDAGGYRIGVETRVTEAAGAAQQVAIDWTGAGYGLAWSDARDGNAAIWFAALSEGGAESAEQPVSDGAGSSGAPSIAWTGMEHALAWHDDRDGVANIRFRRLDQAGAPLGPDVLVAGEDAPAQHPSVAWNGSAFAMVWQDQRSGDDTIWFASCAP